MTFPFCRIAGEQLHMVLAPHVPSQEDKWRWREQDLPRVSQYTYLGIHLLRVVLESGRKVTQLHSVITRILIECTWMGFASSGTVGLDWILYRVIRQS